MPNDIAERLARLENHLFKIGDQSLPDVSGKNRLDLRGSEWSQDELESDSVVSIEGTPILIRVGLGQNSNYIEVFANSDLLWSEGFHRNTHNLTTADVTGWAPAGADLHRYGAMFAVRYGRNRDLFQFWQINIDANNQCTRGASHWDRFHAAGHIRLEWGFGHNREYVVRTHPYGSEDSRWAYNYNPDNQQWGGFRL